MTQRHDLRHEFVEFIPETLAEGVVYVSIPYATAAHLCCCGCGREVTTPLSPTDWTLLFDGETVSLEPSIGNWGFACKSHYWVRNDRVEWAAKWSRGRIKAARTQDRRVKMWRYGSEPSTDSEKPAKPQK